MNSEVELEDLFSFETREAHEAEPYKDIILALGMEIEREPYTPICDKLWLCDYERIEDHGAYVEILNRLHTMTDSILPISNISDFVDVEGGVAWLKFDFNGNRIHWDAEVDNDWLDPNIIVKFDELLQTHQNNLRIYSNHTDFGQNAFFCCFTQTEFTHFKTLAKFKIFEIDEQS
ncbi:MAG: hypothetical protein K2P84_01165 [Undibacterium sp.]|nr:hypothetical protein [Undibacterium sp.]